MDEQRPPERDDRERARRRARLDAVFGAVLPETTADERDPGGGTGSGPAGSRSDAEYQADRPPHHGG